MRIATFNMENIFHRDEHLVRSTLNQSQTRWMQELENLMRKDTRGITDFVRMRELSFLLGFQKSTLQPYVVMRRKAGGIYLRKRNATLEYKASYLSNWNGWVKVNTRPIDEIAVQNKARLIEAVNPDILVLQEVEDRHSLVEFNEHFLSRDAQFTSILVIPSNDAWSRDMGIMTKNGYTVHSVKSHVNHWKDGRKIFDKDFQEYEIRTPTQQTIWLFAAHLQDVDQDKEKSNRLRKLQAQFMAEVYKKTMAQGIRKIVLAGSFSAPSYCDSLSPLLRETNLNQIMKHPTFNVDLDKRKDAGYYSLGAYRMGVNTIQQDYLLLSPELFKTVKGSGLNRKGVWPKRNNQYTVFRSLKTENQQASRHPMVWVEL